MKTLDRLTASLILAAMAVVAGGGQAAHALPAGQAGAVETMPAYEATKGDRAFLAAIRAALNSCKREE